MARFLFVIALVFSLAATGCTVTLSGGTEVGTVLDNGTIYLGWHLFSKKKAERDDYPVGTEHGKFTSIYLTTNHPVKVKRVVAVLGNGERFDIPVAGKWGKNHRTHAIELPGGARGIALVAVRARSTGKHLAKIEIHAVR